MLAASVPLHNVLSASEKSPPLEGELTTPFVGLMRKIYGSQGQQSLNPKELYNTFVKKYTYFKPYTQQDAHEFMRFLLEGLKEEVPPSPAIGTPDTIPRPPMKRTRRRTLMAAGADDMEAHPPNAPDSATTYIDQLFGGKLASFVVCDVCKSVFNCLDMVDCRYRRVMRIIKTFHCQFMMQIRPCYVDETDFVPNFYDQVSTHSTLINTLAHPRQ